MPTWNGPRGVRFDVLERDLFQCLYCGNGPPEVRLEVDHIIPASQGGRDEYLNLAAACFECNRGKRDTLLTSAALAVVKERMERYAPEWIARQERLSAHRFERACERR